MFENFDSVKKKKKNSKIVGILKSLRHLQKMR